MTMDTMLISVAIILFIGYCCWVFSKHDYKPRLLQPTTVPKVFCIDCAHCELDMLYGKLRPVRSYCGISFDAEVEKITYLERSVSTETFLTLMEIKNRHNVCTDYTPRGINLEKSDEQDQHQHPL